MRLRLSTPTSPRAVLHSVLCLLLPLATSNASDLTFSTLQVSAHRHADSAQGGPPGPGAAVGDKMVLGHFDDDASIDSLVLSQGFPVLVRDVEVFGAPLTSSSAVTDIAALPGAGPNGIDAWVTISSSGLEKGWFDSTTGALASQSLNSTSWANALMVASGDIDGDGLTDIAGIAGDGLTILTMINQSGALTAGSSLVSANPIHAMTLADTIPNGSATEIAVADSTGIAYWTYAGVRTQSLFPAATYIELEAIPAQNGGDWIACLTPYGGSVAQYLIVGRISMDSVLDVGVSEAVSVAPVHLAPGLPAAIAINFRTFSTTAIVQHTGSTPAYDAFNFIGNVGADSIGEMGIADGIAHSGLTAQLAAADTDGDGDEDMLYLDPSHGFSVLKNPIVAEASYRPTTTYLDFSKETSSSITLEWSIAHPAVEVPGAKIEVIIYKDGEDIAATGSNSRTLVTFSDPNLAESVKIAVDRSGNVDPHTYYAIIRQVEVDGNDETTDTHASTVIQFTVWPFGSGDPEPVNGVIPRPNANGNC